MYENFSYENQGINSFLKFTFPKNSKPDPLTIGMMTNNEIDGFLPSIYGCMDDISFVKYNISSKISVSQFFSGTVSKKKLISVLKGILTAFISAEDYMIDVKCIVLDLNYIYVNVSTCHTEVVCVPLDSSLKKDTDLKQFFRNLIFTLNYDQTENGDYIAKLINYLNNSASFSVVGFKEVIDGIEMGNNVPAYPSVANIQKNANAYEIQPTVQQEYYPPQNTAYSPSSSINSYTYQQQETSVNTQTYPQQEASYSPAVEQPVSNYPVNNNASAANTPSPPSASFGSNNTESYSIPGMDIPESSLPQQSPDTNSKDPNEKPMTMFYLLQHYNKENAAIYKAQKQSKKNNAALPQQPSISQPSESHYSAPQDNHFVVPGSDDFAVPQSAPYTPAANPSHSSTASSSNAYTSASQNSTQNYSQQPVSSYHSAPSTVNAVSGNFGNTTVLGLENGNYGDTTVLSENGADPYGARPLCAYIIRKKNNERILINKEIFHIGKERSYVDYFIGDNAAISRSHADIVQKNNEYFIVDTNSTNHTYVNGTMITSNVETKLENGCQFKLANEEFEFELS